MFSAAIGNASTPNWGSLHDCHRAMVNGCDRLGVTKKYARRRRVGEAKGEEMEAAAGSPETLRVCSDCWTSKTPLWRSGPSGPKSLCNACGLRYRKRRKRGEINDEGAEMKTNARITPSEVLGQEELKRRQREKQKSLFVLLLERQKQRRRERKAAAAAAEAVRGGDAIAAGEEEAEAALLLLSLSTGILDRS